MRLPTAFFLEASTSISSIIHRRAVINHDAVVSIPQTVPPGPPGELYLKYQPYLHVVNGCVPFPAVDSAGNTSGGLAPTGPPDGDCTSSIGQVYLRSSPYTPHPNPSTSTSTFSSFAIYYSWYMPKDSPFSNLGHRHDWEGIVVWLSSSNSTSASLLGVSASAHGGFQKNRHPPTTTTSGGSTHPLISYFSAFPLNHQLGFTLIQEGAELQPVVAWECLGDEVREALERTDFGSATVPFKDETFQGNLDEAALD